MSAFAVDFNFGMGAGLTVGDVDHVYGGFTMYGMFTKNLLDNRPLDISVQILLGYNIFTFGYGCIVSYEPYHTSDYIETFYSMMSLGYNIRFTDFMSVLASVNVTTRDEVGFTVAVLFNLDIFTYPY